MVAALLGLFGLSGPELMVIMGALTTAGAAYAIVHLARTWSRDGFRNWWQVRSKRRWWAIALGTLLLLSMVASPQTSEDAPMDAYHIGRIAGRATSILVMIFLVVWGWRGKGRLKGDPPSLPPASR